MKNLYFVFALPVFLSACNSSREKDSLITTFSKAQFEGKWSGKLINIYEIVRKVDSTETLMEQIANAQVEEEVVDDSIKLHFLNDSLFFRTQKENMAFRYEIDTTARPRFDLYDKDQLYMIYIDKVYKDSLMLSNLPDHSPPENGKRFVGSYFSLIRE